ncbi:MAG: YraN family protein [Puniceicoccales bacterium]|jgi:putative endonuclease|nr:YraN family protein [Puniceicoccales bacterium]
MLVDAIKSLFNPRVAMKETEAKCIGFAGEIAAKKYLKKIGYKILKTNWSYKNYEIDIIGLDGEILVFVEVRTRSSDALVNGYDSITRKKRESLKIAFNAYLAKIGYVKHHRFDVVDVSMDKIDNTLELRHFENIPLWQSQGYY